MADEIVKVKKSELEALIDANTKAYNILDELTTPATDIEEGIRKAFSALEDAPTEVSSMIVEDDEESNDGEKS